MNLFFLRHGKAYARSHKWRPDSKRPLTPDGEKKMFEVARGIQGMSISFDLILTSPYLRALRTAEILGEVLKSKKMFDTRSLVPDANPQAVIDEIHENFSSFKQIVLVSHEPYMTRLMSLLLTGADKMSIDLKKAGFAKLTIDKLRLGQCAQLHWLLTPRQTAALARQKK